MRYVFTAKQTATSATYSIENRDFCSIKHKLIGFYNRDEKCLQRGTDWVFK